VTAHVRISSSEIEKAKAAAAEAGLRLTSFEKRPDGTIKFEFGEFADNDDWREGSPLYERAQ
jgi:hypothetical protein